VQLIGMLDSPYVRRVAISLQLLGVRFEHRCLSVFRTFEQFLVTGEPQDEIHMALALEHAILRQSKCL